jgi:hypothetical protein
MSRSELQARPVPSEESSTVARVLWPEEADRRLGLARAGVPRLLFVAPDHPVPEPLDLDEDWVRVPASAEEVHLRSANLGRRALERDRRPE